MNATKNPRQMEIDALECKKRYYGKYRGMVVNNVDPKGQGRLLVTVPQISPLPLAAWAMMCTPVGGPQHGMFSVPPPLSGVWVEFEQGEIDYPIWTGCLLGSGLDAPRKAPAANPLLQSITLQTPTQNSVVISDAPGPSGGVQIEVRTGAKITVTDLGIELSNGFASIKMIGDAILIDASIVNINNGALLITK